MKTAMQRLRHHLSLTSSLSKSAPAAIACLVALTFAGSPAHAQTASPSPRIAAEISSSSMTVLQGSKLPVADASNDAGRLSPSTKLQGIGLYFSRTAAQEADLKALIAAQQNPSSGQFHQWLSPEQFGARFGMSDSDIAKVEGWLERQGFSIDSVNRSKTVIRFSGTAGQVETAFATEMHTYTTRSVAGAAEKHFAPSTDLSLPSSLAGVVSGIRNLDDFRPKPRLVARKNFTAKPGFTSSQSGNVFFAPGDIATVYDINGAYNAGYTGTGQTIVIVGQSAIDTSDIENFQNAAGLTVKDPSVLLVPGTGSSTVFADGDETESDLDLEWSGAIAKGATIDFVYTGSNQNYGAFDSIQYAIDEKLGTIISSSYGDCEADIGQTNLTTLDGILEQAAAQGQTVLSAAGDNGSTDCYEDYTNGYLTQAQGEALAVDYPASSAYVTGVGGTEISQASSNYVTAGDGYWEAVGSSDEITSALKYIPEQVWNESTEQYGPEGGGGGASAFFAKPSWQTGVPGIPQDGKRDVPDVSLNASVSYPGYLFCTSDETDWESGQEASCNSGFRDSNTGDLTVAGGTSFATPIFAGMVAILNQKQNYAAGQGLINPELYKLASDSSTYASAFHDITTGNNDCSASGSGECTGSAETEFAAGTGYDQATGLGTIDFLNLADAWPASTSTLLSSSTTVSASNAAPTINTADTFTVTVTGETGSAAPTGTVSITVDGGTATSAKLTTSGTAGVATYSTTFTTTGTHSIIAAYSGDSTYAASTSTVSVTVAGTTSGSGTFKLAATNLTETQGSSGSSTITVTPAGGYTGTVDLTFDTSNDTALQNLCYEFTNSTSSGGGTVSVTGTSAVTTQLSFDSNAADCATTTAVTAHGYHKLSSLHPAGSARNVPSNGPVKTVPAAIAFAGLLLAGLIGRYSRKFRGLAAVIALLAVSVGVSACGGSSSNTISDPGKGTYTITVTGQDSASAAITATTTFTFTID